MIFPSLYCWKLFASGLKDPENDEVVFFEGNNLTPLFCMNYSLHPSFLALRVESLGCGKSERYQEAELGDLWCPGNHRQYHFTARVLACIWHFLNYFLFDKIFILRKICSKLTSAGSDGIMRNESPYSKPLWEKYIHWHIWSRADVSYWTGHVKLHDHKLSAWLSEFPVV